MARYVKAADREAQLLEAAHRVLVREGYQGLTMRTVASEAGVRLSTLQYIFSSRALLLNALIRKVIRDCGFSLHQGGARGLQIELQSLVDWFGAEVLSNPGMRELLRAEFVANVSPDTPGAQDYPAGRPILRRVIHPWLEHMADEGPEVFAVSIPDLADLITTGFAGLTYGFLHDGEVGLYAQSGEVLVKATVAYANPQPRTPDDR